MISEIRVPKQKRSIEKYEKIVDSGWLLFSKNGYYNTNTADIAAHANVSTGIVYQYFKDKHDILIAGINKYGDDIFFPILKMDIDNFDINNFSEIATNMINKYIKEHKISAAAHEEIMSMVHADKMVAKYYYEREMNLTNQIYNMLINNNINSDNLKEKVHIIVGLIDNLCHEIVYHKHEGLNYDSMMQIVIKNISNLIKDY